MNRIVALAGACIMAGAFSIAVAAQKGLGQAEAEQLIKGNTAEGTNKWKKKMIWYFEGSGDLLKRDHLGNKGKASWRIDKKGNFCFQDKQMKNEQCGAIVPSGGGGYDILLEGQWKLEKVTPGNPHGL